LYAGAALGSNAGRISKGILPINNEIYNLPHNDNMNNLHGGFNNVSFQVWTLVKKCINQDSAFITLSLDISDEQDGFPGNRTIYATFTVTNNNELKIKYEALSDKDTYLNLSNHCYFNLTGDFNTSALDHSLTLEADTYFENDENHCAFKLSSVEGTPFDFRKSSNLKSQIEAFKAHPQLILGKGYNNGFVLNQGISKAIPALILKSPKGQIALEVFTDAPAIVLYSGGYIEEGLLLNDGSLSKPSCALAIEPQDYPNGPNLPFVQTAILSKSEKYERNIVYKFRIPECRM
ncbi:MAG: aldose epimerase family protein, partial [Clostridium sp.]